MGNFTGVLDSSEPNSSKIYKHPGDRGLEALRRFAAGGWQNSSEYDPSKIPPPRKRMWLFRDGNMLYVLGGMFCLSLTIALCTCIFGDGAPKKKGYRGPRKDSEKDQ